MDKVVTRIAPSPTGEMHIGTVRSALYNYLFAKQQGGTYFVRIEDTDRERNKPEWVEAIWRDFEWCGLPSDKRYIQSEHLPRHRELLKKLIDEDKAYLSREPKKDDPTQEIEVVRLRNPGKMITFEDLIRGEITFDTTELGDFVIARAIDDPLYHFVVVVDDGDAGVTHVLRAEEHLSNTPRQILILEALGFTRPVYAHLPLILAPDRSKLSKRKHGASIGSYRAQGFIPEAIINYLALLGWNPGTEQEFFTMDELIKTFSIERVQKSGAVFDIQKMLWFNHEYLQRLSDDEYKKRLEDFTSSSVDSRLVPLLKERSRTLGEAAEALKNEFDFLSHEPTLDQALLMKGAKVDAATAHMHLEKVIELIGNLSHEAFTPEEVKKAVFDYATKVGRGAVLWPMRVALSGKEKSPDPFALAALLGKEETLRRLTQALAVLK
jgi:glutamyl-tRNA synthetase